MTKCVFRGTLNTNTNNEVKTILNKMVNELSFTEEESMQFLTEYLEYLPEVIAELETACERNDEHIMRQTAHKIKGSSSNLRIENIALLCNELGNAVKENKGQNVCKEIIGQLSNHHQYLSTLLTKFVQYDTPQ